jgi:hypothetical protein
MYTYQNEESSRHVPTEVIIQESESEDSKNLSIIDEEEDLEEHP